MMRFNGALSGGHSKVRPARGRTTISSGAEARRGRLGSADAERVKKYFAVS
jgi:hypothetical protein